MIADKIRMLREKMGITQSELAGKLGVTRSGVNAWEMGVTTPSTVYVTELALLFGVSTDYLLDMPGTKTISAEGLTDREIASLTEIAECYRAGRRSSDMTAKAARFSSLEAFPQKDKIGDNDIGGSKQK